MRRPEGEKALTVCLKINRSAPTPEIFLALYVYPRPSSDREIIIDLRVPR